MLEPITYLLSWSCASTHIWVEGPSTQLMIMLENLLFKRYPNYEDAGGGLIQAYCFNLISIV